MFTDEEPEPFTPENTAKHMRIVREQLSLAPSIRTRLIADLEKAQELKRFSQLLKKRADELLAKATDDEDDAITHLGKLEQDVKLARELEAEFGNLTSKDYDNGPE